MTAKTTTANGVLAIVTDPLMRDDVDRVAAAAGLAVVHVAQQPSRQAWTGASAVLLDAAGVRLCSTPALPRRTGVVLLSQAEPRTADFQAAISVGAEHVLTLPADEADLVTLLSEIAESRRDDARTGQVVAVMGGRGGAGASLFATALALTASDALLVDADPWGGGIDLAAGSENLPGLRWPDVAVEHGRLSISSLRQALPRRNGVAVLSCARTATNVDAGPLAAVIDAGRRGGGTVVCDLPRRATPAVEIAADAADLVVLVTTADVRACASAAATASALLPINPNVGLVVRGPAPGGLGSAEVARIVGLPLLAALRPQTGLSAVVERDGLRLRRGSPLARAARRVLNVLAHHPKVQAA